MKKFLLSLLSIILTISLVACSNNNKTTSTTNDNNLKKVDFLLDWTPNTNHSGLYVAKEKGFFKEVGIDLNIQPASEDSSSDLVINNKAPFTIYFQDTMATKLAKGAPITAVAAIIEHNTSGIISKKETNITTAKNLEDKNYGTWNDPIELAMIKSMLEKSGGDFSKINLVPNTDSNSMTGIENKTFDAAWVFYAWDGLMAKDMKIDTNFFYLKDADPVLDYYSPVIIANNDYLANNKEEAKKIIAAIKKGYIYAMENPEEAANILIKYAPELKEKSAFVLESQKYLSKAYATDKNKWGRIDATRWNNFYKWINENKISESEIPLDKGFTNEYLD